MGIITLTDRISVSVRAKNEAESNSQKRATGRNIAKALGNDNISDSLADQIGATSKPTIADEQGREWVSMSDIIAAGKKMQQNGAFAVDENHEGITENGILYNLNPVYTGPIHGEKYWDANGEKLWITRDWSSNAYFIISGGNLVYFSKEQFSVSFSQVSYPFSYYNNPPSGSPSDPFETTLNSSAYSAYSIPINNVTYSFFYVDASDVTYDTNGGSNVYTIDSSYVSEEHNYFPTGNTWPLLAKCMAGYLFGPTHQTGGSLIDWTKPDDEIEEDIRNLHETWDVSDHPGASGQGIGAGTYILAGPIEYNDADPVG